MRGPSYTRSGGGRVAHGSAAAPLPAWRDFNRFTLPALFLAVACVRVALVGLYAESLPYWDQWDAEGRRLLAPWLEGTLSWDELLINPHNEHRIAWTRLLFLGLFALNGKQWDNLVTAYANTLLFASIYTFLYALLARELRTTWQKAVLAAVLIVLAVLPYAWENTLVGFQNQFYFLIGFAVATLALAARGADRAATVVGVAALAFGSLFTMASGPLVAPVAATLLGLRMMSGSLGRVRGLVAVGLLLAIAVAGFAAVPEFSPHAAWKADSLHTWLNALRVPGSWPLSPSWFHVLVAWSPLLLYCAFRFRLGWPPASDLLGLGLAGWALAQAAAIAYSRSNIEELSSRYGDLMAIGVVANVWFGLRACDPWPGRLRSAALQRAAGLVSALAVLIALCRRTPDDHAALARLSDAFRRQTASVRAFVADDDPVHLTGDIPYPDPTMLQGMLSNAAIRQALPPTLRKGLSLAGPAGEPFVALGSIVSSCSATQCAEGVGRLRGADLTTRFAFIRFPVFYGQPKAGFKLGVCGGKAAEHCDLEPLSGRLFTAAAGGETVHVEVADETPASWIALGSAIEVNWLSLLSRHVKVWTRRAIPLRSSVAAPQPASREVPCADESEAHAWDLSEGTSLYAEVPISRAGLLTGVVASRGPFERRSDGWLHGEVCAEGRCVLSTLRLWPERNRSSFELPLSTPLAVRTGDKLQVRFWIEAATHPAAFASCLARQDSARVWGDPAFDPQGRTLRLRLDYLPLL